MIWIFLLFSFSLCKKVQNEPRGFWNLTKVKALQNTSIYKNITSFLDSFSPESSNSNFVSSALNNFRNRLISYKKSFLLSYEKEYLLNREKNKILRNANIKANKMKKEGIEIPKKIKDLLSSIKLPNDKDTDSLKKFL